MSNKDIKPQVLICGGIAIDDINLPTIKLRNVVGGSTIYASLASSLFAPTAISGSIGKDFPGDFLDLLKKRGVELRFTQRSDKPSFRWRARYANDLAEVTTINQQMNAFTDFDPQRLKGKLDSVKYAFISNIDPDIQNEVIDLLPKSAITILDSMDLWMIEKLESLKRALAKVDVLLVNEEEAHYLIEGSPPVPEMVEKIMGFGPRIVLYKKGEYGLTMYGKYGTMVVPSYPLVFAIDPSGAGDVLGGSIAGVLARIGKFDAQSMRTAVLIASIVASFTVEQYATEALIDLSLKEVLNRTNLFLQQLPQKTDIENIA